MGPTFDFTAGCRPGMALKTRGRSEVVITAVDAAAGLVYGEVRMYGPCVWRRDGLYRDAPAGAAGPLDLAPPTASAVAAKHPTASVRDTLADPGHRDFCCD